MVSMVSKVVKKKKALRSRANVFTTLDTIGFTSEKEA